VTNTPRQFVHRSTSLPSVGASTGATPITRSRREKTFAAADPENRSRTTAEAITAAEATPKPCRIRSEPRTVTLGATAQSKDASTCTARPMTSGRLRPKASESGPMIT
jgi:hypothetical protein